MNDFFEGATFTIQGGYLKRGKNFLHRMIWEKEKGPIPQGHHIHHKDGNKLNNSINNLECLSHSDHLRLHMKKCRKRFKWHKSDEGRKKLGELSKERWKNRKKYSVKCAHCGNEFECLQVDRAKYCDNKCEQAARRMRGDDLVERSCVICGESFAINKYHKTRTCGYKCGDRLRRKDLPHP